MTELEDQMVDAYRRQMARRTASVRVNRIGWTDEQWIDDAERLMCEQDGAVTSLVNGHAMALLRAVRAKRESRPRPFVLVRDEDVTGVSGTGIVAEGVEFTGDAVALRWLSDWPTSVVFHDRGIDSVLAVHGHGGKTRIEWQ